MEIYYKISSKIPQKCVATVGFFDGLHLGHRYIIKKLQEEAKLLDTEELVITFSSHPAEFFGRDVLLLSTFYEKLSLFENAGVKNLLVLPFDASLSQLTGTEFVEEILYKKLGVKKLVLGYNNSIGRKDNGRSDILTSVVEIERLQRFSLLYNDDISSSSIRKLLSEGNICTANGYLGYDYAINGRVVHGKAIGRRLNFPTANLELSCEQKCLPKNGVYAVMAEVEGKCYKGMLNIGMCPTFCNNSRSIELHILGFGGDLYGQDLKVIFKKYLRGERKFESLQALAEQLKIDKQTVEQVLAD